MQDMKTSSQRWGKAGRCKQTCALHCHAWGQCCAEPHWWQIPWGLVVPAHTMSLGREVLELSMLLHESLLYIISSLQSTDGYGTYPNILRSAAQTRLEGFSNQTQRVQLVLHHIHVITITLGPLQSCYMMDVDNATCHSVVMTIRHLLSPAFCFI